MYGGDFGAGIDGMALGMASKDTYFIIENITSSTSMFCRRDFLGAFFMIRRFAISLVDGSHQLYDYFAHSVLLRLRDLMFAAFESGKLGWSCLISC
jgi:hypothetical protein